MIRFLTCRILGQIIVSLLLVSVSRAEQIVISVSSLFAAWVGSLAFGIMFFMGPLATALCDNMGCRVVTCVGGLLSFVGLFTTSYVTNFVLLYFTYGLLWGVGTSFCYFASLVILPMHFRKYLSLAYGIAIAGAGLGVPPMTWLINQLIGYYNWRVTIRILAGITLLMCAASLSYGQIAISRRLYLKLDKKELIRNLHGGIHHKLKLHLLEFISLNPWNNKAFAVWAVSLSFIAFGNFIPFVFLVSTNFLFRFMAYVPIKAVVYHLPNFSAKSGWEVNGTQLFGWFQRKISGSNGTSKKVVLFFRTECSKRKFVFHFKPLLLPVSGRGCFLNGTNLYKWLRRFRHDIYQS